MKSGKDTRRAKKEGEMRLVRWNRAPSEEQEKERMAETSEMGKTEESEQKGRANHDGEESKRPSTSRTRRGRIRT